MVSISTSGVFVRAFADSYLWFAGVLSRGSNILRKQWHSLCYCIIRSFLIAHFTLIYRIEWATSCWHTSQPLAGTHWTLSCIPDAAADGHRLGDLAQDRQGYDGPICCMFQQIC